MHTFSKLASALGALGLAVAVLAACSSGTPLPAQATINGVSALDRSAGTAELSVSALDSNGVVLRSGTIGESSATVDQAGFSVDANVCGQIASLGPVVAALTLDATPSLTSDCSGTCPVVPNDPFDADGDTARRQGALAFVDRMGNDGRAAVSYFNASDGLVNVLPFSSDRILLAEAVREASSPAAIGGGTTVWDASLNTIDMLEGADGENRIAIIFTDGADTSSVASPEEVAVAAREAGVRVFYIGLGEALNVAAMQDIASATDHAGLYASAADRESLLDAFDGVTNSAQGSGCIGLAFDPVPAPEQTMTGSIQFTVDGAEFVGGYRMTF